MKDMRENKMILAEKIIALRKKQGWSQEDLADKLDVSRQSVSKWESTTSIPDLEKIIKLSELFGVSTDYLIKDTDESTDERFVSNNNSEASGEAREISLEFATEYMDCSAKVGKKIALGAMLCIFSPIILIILAGAADANYLSEKVAVTIGLAALFSILLVAVIIIVFNAMTISKYDFLEKENITLKYGVEAVVLRKKEAFENVFKMSICIGVGLILGGLIPLVISSLLADDFIVTLFVSLFLALVAIAVYVIVSNSMVKGSFDKLLEECDYTREEKAKTKSAGVFAVPYWCLVTAIGVFLLFSNFSIQNYFWLSWVIGGILYAPYLYIAKAIANKNRA